MRFFQQHEYFSLDYARRDALRVGVKRPGPEPEFAFEKEVSNVEKAVHELGVTYPVAVDSHYAIWNAFGNQYWPAHYLIDGSGRIRDHHFGEGEYEESERVIQQLLAELKAAPLSSTTRPSMADVFVADCA